MATQWQTLPIEDAQKHPLYGVRGWLLVFSIGMTLGLLRELGSINGDVHSAGLTLSEFFSIEHPAVTYTKFALGIHAFVITIIYWLLLSKHPLFRKTASTLLLISWPLVAVIGLAYSFPGLGNALAQGFIQWAFSCTIWVTYLQKSKRVRVTFEKQIPLDSPNESNSIAKDQSNAFAKTSLRSATQPNHKDVHALLNQVSVSSNTPSEKFWATALAEFESDKRRSGLWARVFAEANGDDAVAKAKYLSCRASELQIEHERQLTEVIQNKKEQAHETELTNSTNEGTTSDRTPIAKCPSCASIIPHSSLACPKCNTILGSENVCSMVTSNGNTNLPPTGISSEARAVRLQTENGADSPNVQIVRPVTKFIFPMNGDTARKAAQQLGYIVYVEDAGLLRGYRYTVIRGKEAEQTFANESDFVRWARNEIKAQSTE